MNMSARIALVGMLAALPACSGRGGGGTGGGSGGATGTGGGNCAPFCGTAGGTATGGGTGGAGGNTGGGMATGGGTGVAGGSGFDAGQVARAKTSGFCSVPVALRGVVVSAIQSTTAEVGTGNIRQNFWVVDPGNPSNALFGFKDYLDTIGGMNMTRMNVGDVVNIDGFLVSNFANSGINQGAEAYRYSLQDACNNLTPMAIVVLDGGVVLPDIMAPNPFGLNPDGGKPKGYTVGDQRFIQQITGGRVHIPGPLTLSNAEPVEMQRWFDGPGGTVFGFEVSGPNLPAGVLVRTSNTFRLPDGGAGNGSGQPPCDYRQLVADGGRMVSFPNGIHGVWDTWTQTPCYNGTASCAFNQKDAGLVPGLLSNYTYAVFPIDCNDMAGAVVTP